MLADPSSLDFHELAGSPTIDKGTDDPQNGATDPDGRPRFLGAAPDIGAYEFPAAGAVTSDATDVTKTDARLNGTVDSEGTDTPTSWAFDYGTSPSLGQTVPIPDATLPAGVHPIPFGQAVNELLTGLTPGTTYYYRVRATNPDGETFGAIHTFTTDANLTVSFAGSGHGTVNSSPDIGGCGQSCTLDAKAGTTYTLTATAAPGSLFSGWSGAGCSGNGRCSLALSTNATVTVTFARADPPTLSSVKLTGVRGHKPKLTFTVTHGANVPDLKRLEVTLSRGYAFGNLHHAIHVSDPAALARVARGVLIIKLPVPVPQLTVKLVRPAIMVTNRKRHLRLTVTVKDAAGTVTPLFHTLK
jgi:hypothetical protein